MWSHPPSKPLMAPASLEAVIRGSVLDTELLASRAPTVGLLGKGPVTAGKLGGAGCGNPPAQEDFPELERAIELGTVQHISMALRLSCWSGLSPVARAS